MHNKQVLLDLSHFLVERRALIVASQMSWNIQVVQRMPTAKTCFPISLEAFYTALLSRFREAFWQIVGSLTAARLFQFER